MLVGCAVRGCSKGGRTRGLCQAHYHRLLRYGDPTGRPPTPLRRPPPLCAIEGCGRLTHARGWCRAHYARWRATGDVGADRPIIDGTSPIKGYRWMTARGHPLAHADGRVREHRYVLYECIGPGEHPCHWCGAVVSWAVVFPAVGALVTDHLNWDRSDNRPENIVASCGPCNSHRWKNR